MKKMIVVVVLMLVMALSACGPSAGNVKYNDLKVGDYYLYYNKPGIGVMCDMITGPVEFVAYGSTVYVYDEYFGNCARTLYILDEGVRTSLTDAWLGNLITENDINTVEWGFDIYPTFNIFSITYKKINFLDDNEEEFYSMENQDVLDLAIALSGVHERFVEGYVRTISEHDSLLGYVELIDNDSVKTTVTVYSNGMYIDSLNSSSWGEYGSLFQNRFNEELNK